MANVLKMKAADLVKKANREEKIEVSFDLKIGTETRTFYLTAPDMFDILKEQEICYQDAFTVCADRGLDKRKINESDWLKELTAIEDSDTRKAMQKDKPANLAEQVAKKNSRFDTIRVLIPKVLKEDVGSGKVLAFESLEDQKAFGEYIASHPDVMNTITKHYVEIMNKLNEVNAIAKNSPTDKDSMITDSGKVLSEGSQVMELPGVQN